MEKTVIAFEDFLRDVDPAYHAFINQMNDRLLQSGCKVRLELAKSGYVVSYDHPKSKRVVLNFVFRKGGLVVRVYGDHVNSYQDLLETLPGGMLAAIAKAPSCKRLLDPAACSSRCPMGYDFTVKGERYKKCRYGALMFPVSDENLPFLGPLIERELAERDCLR